MLYTAVSSFWDDNADQIALRGQWSNSQGGGGRRLDFGTHSSDQVASLLAGALKTLHAPIRDLAAEAETVEILQVALSKRGRQQLQTAGKSAGVKVLLTYESSAGPTGRRFEFADR